jgi:hypothetical protein
MFEKDRAYIQEHPRINESPATVAAAAPGSRR